MKVAFTGHRPNKIGGYDRNNQTRRLIRHAIGLKLRELHATYVITGGALGVDTDAANVAWNLDIPYSVIAPCQNHSSKWPAESQREYNVMCSHADEHRIIDVPYSPAAMQRRNEIMVNECDVLIAIWDGSSGGTANCVRYARSKKKTLIIINPNTLEVT